MEPQGWMPYQTLTAESHTIRPLTKKQEQYARNIVLGKANRDYRWDKLPQVQQAIEDIRKQSRALVAYDLSRAMFSCEKAIDFAYKKENPMAVVKGTELICKLAGLLIEKHEVLTVSLKEALQLAKERADSRKQIVQAEPQAVIEIKEIMPACDDKHELPSTSA